MTILLLEDEPLIALDIKDALEASGYQVRAFPETGQAQVWLETDTPKAAIVDLKLRDGDCLSLREELRARGVPLIVHTAAEPSGPAFDSGDQYAAVVGKPAQPSDLVSILDNVLNT